MRSVEEQLSVVLAAVNPVASETIALDRAYGRTLRESVFARVDIPVFDNSAMDGFAVRYADVAGASPDSPVTLRVVADLPAGTDIDPSLGAGEAARIMTGSPVPADADGIVPFEGTTGGLADSLETVTVVAPPSGAGVHVRRRGSDARVGDLIVPAGRRLAGFQISAAAAAGVAEVVVARTPRVAVISTGSELALPGVPLTRGQIPESNSLLLAGLVTDADAEVVLRSTVADDVEALRAALAEASALSADVVITSGGVSAGAYEVVKDTLGPGGELEFAKVAMQPGKPQGFGRLADGALMFGLPGNPVSVAVSFEVFVRPALLAMQGRGDMSRAMLRLPAATGWRTPPGRRQYLPAALDRSDPARWTVRPASAGGSGSHLAGGIARAEIFAIVAADVDEIAPGDLVDVMLIT
ncbi:gephyrin-like molybdotransferase Glp [Microbacterium sp. P02]|uniref:molybdopterin molybdotransferase MoeA n=1 Tax=Microbacterium sp. P02 TaxID=3366260 RepID=UPI00366AAB43